MHRVIRGWRESRSCSIWRWQACTYCSAHRGKELQLGCEIVDCETDGDIDLCDFVWSQAVFTGNC